MTVVSLYPPPEAWRRRAESSAGAQATLKQLIVGIFGRRRWPSSN